MKMLSIISTLCSLGSALVVSLASCGQGGGSGQDDTAQTVSAASQVPIAYDLDHPTVYTLPEELREVSGISFLKGDPGLLYAEQDEKGILYWLAPGDKQAREYKFGKDGDYEDLALMSGKVIFLKSNGTLYGFDFVPAPGADQPPVTGKVQQWDNLLPKGEYEGLYADTASRELFVLCKECKNEDHTKAVTVYSYKLDSQGQGWSASGTAQVDVTKISQLSNDLTGHKKKKAKKINFKPSAISLNPLTHEWYILSSVNKMLVVTAKNWEVKAVYPLDSKLYPQPEGMCFDRDNNLYISNEGPDGKEGTLLKLPLKGN